ncbi:MAG TPA: energy-coupling factor ABC transporter permease [Synergistaceae bacterium]|mgnify:FL=1|nr:energy-coupling factor ABC transporter permease [Synergistaceae bacterium]
MHMADALLSPAVGGALWAVSAGLVGYAARKLDQDPAPSRAPLMGALGAFVFAAQMINFTIPGTGSSGHMGGGLLLAALLGPHAAFLVLTSVLAVQALFFADGGLLALGCNIFNMGFFSCFVAYPLIFRPMTGENASSRRILGASLAASIVGLALGALAVVLETGASGISSLPFGTFVLLMLPIHLAIGVGEGFITASVVLFARRVQGIAPERSVSPGKPLVMALVVLALLTGGVLSWFASTHPDGLEWSLFHATGQEEVEGPATSVHTALANVQERTALLPDYALPASDISPESSAPEGDASWPAVSGGTSLAGIAGGLLTGLLALALGWGLRRRQACRASS